MFKVYGTSIVVTVRGTVISELMNKTEFQDSRTNGTIGLPLELVPVV